MTNQMKRNRKSKTPVVLPPTEFSNAMIDIYGSCSAVGWQDSKEWRLFCAGRASAAAYLANLAAEMSKDEKELSRW